MRRRPQAWSSPRSHGATRCSTGGENSDANLPLLHSVRILLTQSDLTRSPPNVFTHRTARSSLRAAKETLTTSAAADALASVEGGDDLKVWDMTDLGLQVCWFYVVPLRFVRILLTI